MIRRGVLPFAFLSLLLAGCSESPSGSVARVGQLAPEIAGQDLDGTQFKLSDYRGKVVLLDFWGDW